MAKTTVPGLYKSEGLKGGFDPLDEGTYLLEVTNAEWRKAQSSGNDMLHLELQVIEGPEQDNERNPEGRKVFENLVVLDKDHKSFQFAVDKLKSACKAFGVEVSKSGAVEDMDFIGKKAEAEIGIEEREDPRTGKIRRDNRIRYYYITEEED